MHDARFSVVIFFFRRCMTKNLLIFLLVQMPINLNPAAEETTLGSTGFELGIDHWGTICPLG